MIFNKIKFVYFDVGGVMLKFNEGIEKLSKIFEVEYGACYDAWRQLDDSVCLGKLKPQDMWLLLKKRFGYLGEDIDFIEFWVSNFEKIPATYDLLYELSDRIPMGLLTNIYSGTFEVAKNHGYIPNIKYQSIVMSCENSVVKPDGRIYEIAKKKSQVEHHEILFIDDLEEYIDPAKKLGWSTVLFETNAPNKSIKEIKRLLKIG
ncbi:HAD-IA family hydrolase [Patescibacteria group bacterium]|nr:HAD-IA family hydrolase [Patescibacteria group bacterium]